jgi:hypothetical protein
MTPLLCILIPTYNRPYQFQQNLQSILECANELAESSRKLISLSIHNNSTRYFEQYIDIISSFRSCFESISLGAFNYTHTGLNIGSYQNIVGGLISCAHSSDYVWILPDDDFARFDSLQLLVKILQEYRPCFVSGAAVTKAIHSYNPDKYQEESFSANRIHHVFRELPDKIDFFVRDNVVQAQEYVYNSILIINFFRYMPHHEFANEMFPGTLGLYCLFSDSPYITLSQSIGIFRDDDPNSEWRHLWFKYALIDWPEIASRFLALGFLDKCQYLTACRTYESLFKSISHRFDVLSGLNRYYQLNPIQLFTFHRFVYLRCLVLSPFKFLTRTITYFIGF